MPKECFTGFPTIYWFVPIIYWYFPIGYQCNWTKKFWETAKKSWERTKKICEPTKNWWKPTNKSWETLYYECTKLHLLKSSLSKMLNSLLTQQSPSDLKPLKSRFIDKILWFVFPTGVTYADIFINKCIVYIAFAFHIMAIIPQS